MQKAHKPMMDYLAARSIVGTVSNVPEGMVPESDTANMAILSFDPKIYSKGRSPLEAVSMGIEMQPDETAYRCNVVTLTENDGSYEDQIILDHSADEITTPELRYITMRMTNGEIRENHYYFAQLKTSRELVSNEGQLCWFRLDELDSLPMAYTARYMIDHWLETGRHTECVYGGVADGEKVVFTELYDC